jgi:hypothetical protein
MKTIIKTTAITVTTIIFTLLILNQFTMKTIQTEIIINAERQDVWNTLMDYDSYPKWNPFIKKISGDTNEGDILNVSILSNGNKPMKFTPVVLKNIIEKEFRWKGKLFIPGVFDGEHYFILESYGNNQTKFTHGENFTGLFSGALIKVIYNDTKNGFITMNKALKELVESK